MTPGNSPIIGCGKSDARRQAAKGLTPGIAAPPRVSLGLKLAPSASAQGALVRSRPRCELVCLEDKVGASLAVADEPPQERRTQVADHVNVNDDF